MRQEIRFTNLVRLQQPRRVIEEGNFDAPVVLGLRMDSPPPVSAPNRKKGLLIWFIIAATFLVVGIVAIISSNKPGPEPDFVWLDQTQFARQMHPGRLKRLYYKVVNFTAPVWRYFSRPRTQILITSKILSVHGVTASQLNILEPMATNGTGAQVWLLSPSQLADLGKRLKTVNGIDVVNAPRLITSDGERASIFVGSTRPQTLASIGISMDLSPNIVAHHLQLAMNALFTDENDGPTMPIRTNLSAAFRVRLSNAGGVLMSSPKDLNGTNYWLILSPTAIDGFGKPTKL
jgi:hypothetical protein